MSLAPSSEVLPQPMPGQANTYRPEDIKRWGVARFLSEIAPQAPFPIPDLDFTPEEDERMNQLLQEEEDAATDGL